MNLLNIGISFFKIGAFTFGGGYAMIPIIFDEVCRKNNWLEEKEMDKIIVISQSLPGVMAVNCAIQVGFRLNGILGALCAMLSVVTPAFLMITLLADIIIEHRENEILESIFFTVRAAVVGLILLAAIKLSKNIWKQIDQIIIFFGSLIVLVVFQINPIVLIFLGGCYGIIRSIIRRKENDIF